MLRATTLGTLLALTASLGVVTAPAGAAPSDPGTAKQPTYQPWGSTDAPDRVLRKGCRNYRYAYTVTPPTDDWAAEFWRTDPRGRALASGAVDVDSDPARGTRVFRFCRASTTTGRFTIRMKVTYLDGYDLESGHVKPSHFRLRKPA